MKLTLRELLDIPLLINYARYGKSAMLQEAFRLGYKDWEDEILRINDGISNSFKKMPKHKPEYYTHEWLKSWEYNRLKCLPHYKFFSFIYNKIFPDPLNKHHLLKKFPYHPFYYKKFPIRKSNRF